MNRVYFSVADRQLERSLDFNAFERSLVHDTLFQPGILIPDIFCFISEGLERHVLGSGERRKVRQSLFEACISNSLIIPAFRAGVSSFDDVLDKIRGEGDPSRAIQGVRANAGDVAARLQHAADSNPNFSPINWPNVDMGLKFQQVVESYLTHSDPTYIDQKSGIDRRELNDLWKITEKWRTDCVYEAVDKTRQIAGVGLRRGEVMNAVGRNLGLPQDRRVNDIADLFPLAKSTRQYRALEYFWRWVNSCYHYNQAKEFMAIPSFPGYDPLGGLIASSVLPAGSPLDAKTIISIQDQVKLPPMEVLLRMTPTELVTVRQELGAGYLTDLETWQRQPNETNAKRVHEALREYASEIRRRAAEEQTFRDSVLDVILGAGATPSRMLLSVSLGVVASAASILEPWVTPLVGLGGIGYVIYLWSAGRPKDIPIKITTTQPKSNIPLDLNLSEQKERPS